MKFAESDPNEGYFITMYNDETIQVNGKNFYSSLILSCQQLKSDWLPRSPAALSHEHFDPIIQLKPEVVLIGTGHKLIFPSIEIYSELIKRGVGVEFMDTGAACRTYNILNGEGRNVVCGLILQGEIQA